MQKKHILTLIVGILVLSGLVLASPYLMSNQANGGLLANVGTGINNINKAGAKALNFFLMPALPYLHLDAPVFSFLSLDKSVFDPKTIIESLTTTFTPTAAVIVNKPSNLPDTVENSLVNIFCSQRIGNLRKTITGSGVLISNDGTVLTNAHVAEYPLVADSNKNVVCLARSGSPASNSYSVRVVFVSPEWIKTSGQYINTMGAPETGENDFALLKITNTDGTPAHLRVSPTQKDVGRVGSVVNAVSYPANVLGTKGVNAPLALVREALSIYDLSSFYGSNGGQNDTIETTPSFVVGQKGSSGGALTDQRGDLVGMITLTTDPDQQGHVHIKGLTMDYLHNALSTYTEGGLDSVTKNGSASIKASFDANYRSSLTSLLLGYLSL